VLFGGAVVGYVGAGVVISSAHSSTSGKAGPLKAVQSLSGVV